MNRAQGSSFNAPKVRRGPVGPPFAGRQGFSPKRNVEFPDSFRPAFHWCHQFITAQHGGIKPEAKGKGRCRGQWRIVPGELMTTCIAHTGMRAPPAIFVMMRGTKEPRTSTSEDRATRSSLASTEGAMLTLITNRTTLCASLCAVLVFVTPTPRQRPQSPSKGHGKIELTRTDIFSVRDWKSAEISVLGFIWG